VSGHQSPGCLQCFTGAGVRACAFARCQEDAKTGMYGAAAKICYRC
jgi:hypothetical protein